MAPRITVAQLAARFETLEERLNAILETVEIGTPASKQAASKQPASKQAASKQPAYVNILTVTDKFPTLAQIEKALLPDQCQFWAHRKHDGTAKAKESYRENMPALIVQCNKAKCTHKPGEFRTGRPYAGSEGYYAERAGFHKRWRDEFGPVSEKVAN